MLDISQLLQAQRGLKFAELDDLNPKPPIAIAMSQKTKQMLLEHPSISKTIVNDCARILPLSIRILTLDNIEDGILPLFENREVKAILRADSSYDKSFQSISFLKWFSVLLESIDFEFSQPSKE